MIDYWSPFCVLNLKEEKHTTKKKGRGQIVKGGFILFLDFKIKILFCCFQDFCFFLLLLSFLCHVNDIVFCCKKRLSLCIVNILLLFLYFCLLAGSRWK